MTDGRDEVLADQFEAQRPHLHGVAYRMLGSRTEADDAVQEAWFRLSRSDADTIDNLGGWLTTVVARVCLDMLRSRTARREQPLDATASSAPAADTADPEHEAMVADSVGLALLVLETLSPGERVAFVLHDMFVVPFDEIASVIGRSPDATRASSRAGRAGVCRARPTPRTRIARAGTTSLRRSSAAARDGEFDTLLALLDPDVVLRADAAAVQTGAPDDLRGAQAVAGTFSGRARGAQVAIVDGAAGLVWARGGTPQVVFEFTFDRGAITRIEMVAEPDVLAELDVVVVREPTRIVTPRGGTESAVCVERRRRRRPRRAPRRRAHRRRARRRPPRGGTRGRRPRGFVRTT